MAGWVSKLDKWLPHWLENTQLQWLQWIYALWQIVRGNPLTLLLLSFLPFKFAQWRNKKHVVVVGDSKDYDTETYDQMYEYVNSHPLTNIEILEWLESNMCTVKHRGHIYLTNRNVLCELTKCSQLFEDNIIFVECLLPVARSLAVGRKLTQTEAYEKLFTKYYHCGKGPRYVVPTFLDYGTDFNSKIWGVLSAIPVLLQARSYNRLSTLVSLVIIILDLNKGRLYKVYDDLFNRFAKFVKLNAFKKKTAWYDFCSIFSSRWRYSDFVKKCAYVAQPGEKLTICFSGKVNIVDDMDIGDWYDYAEASNDQHVCVEILKDGARCSLRVSGWYADVTLRRPVYVS